MRVGIDLVSVEEVRASIREHGESYLARVYTAGERSDCRADGPDPAASAPERLAARWAAKEAVLKALHGPHGVPWTDIEVVRDARGTPRIELSGAAARAATEQGLDAFELSFTHEGSYAAAIVVAGSVAVFRAGYRS